MLVKSHPPVQVAVAKRAKKDVLTEMAETAKADQAQYERESNQRAKEREMSLSIKWLKADQKYELAKLKLENKRKQIELEAGLLEARCAEIRQMTTGNSPGGGLGLSFSEPSSQLPSAFASAFGSPVLSGTSTPFTHSEFSPYDPTTYLA